MPEIPLPIVGGFHKSLIPRLNDQRAVNLIPYIEEDGAKHAATLRLAAGMKKFAVGGRAPCRGGGVVLNGSQFWVFGDELVEIDSNGVRTVRGTLGTTIGRVSMAATHIELGIVDGLDDLYVWNTATSTFTTVDMSANGDIDNAADGVNPTHIVVKDFYFIINRTGGPLKWQGYFYVSTPNDATSWPGDKTNAESDPTDNILAIEATSNEIALFGQRTVQFYFNSGNQDFPFDPARGRDLTVGIGAAKSLARSTDTLFFVAQSKDGKRSIVQVPGGIISDQSISAAMRKMPQIADAYGFCYEIDEHLYYQLTFPAGGATWVYDVTTRMWHERATHGRDTHAAAGVCWNDNRLFVGRDDTGLIYEWDPDTNNDDGDPIHWERRTVVVHASGRPIFIEEVEIEFDSGQGLSSEEEATCTLDVSFDGGHNYVNAQTAAIGATGNYTKLVRFFGLGAGKEVIFRLRGEHDYPWTILGARLRFSLGTHAF